MIDSAENSIPPEVEISIALSRRPADENFVPRDSAICDYSELLADGGTVTAKPNSHYTISKRAWDEILKDIAAADKPAVKAALEAAAQRYINGVDSGLGPGQRVWKRLQKWARRKSVQELPVIIRGMEPGPLFDELQRLAEQLVHLPGRVALARPIDRSEQLRRDALRVWTEIARKRLTVSPSGPLQRFLLAFTSPFLGRKTGRTYAGWAKEEKEWRRLIEPLRLRGQGGFKAEAAVIGPPRLR